MIIDDASIITLIEKYTLKTIFERQQPAFPMTKADVNYFYDNVDENICPGSYPGKWDPEQWGTWANLCEYYADRCYGV